MSDPAPLACEQLHEIAVRRRGDAKALLLEIKRLHGVLVRAHELTGHLVKHDGDLTAWQPVERLLELLEAEPAVDEPPRSPHRKQKRPELEQRFPAPHRARGKASGAG